MKRPLEDNIQLAATYLREQASRYRWCAQQSRIQAEIESPYRATRLKAAIDFERHAVIFESVAAWMMEG
jgi:hypothetical protein